MRRFLITAVISIAMSLIISTNSGRFTNIHPQFSTFITQAAIAQEEAGDAAPVPVEPSAEQLTEQPALEILPESGGDKIFQDDYLPPDLPETTIETFSPWRATAGALFVLGLLMVFVWAAKKYMKPGTVFTATRRLKLLETMPLGAGKQLMLVRAAGHVLLLGITQAGITALDKFSFAELENHDAGLGAEDAVGLEEEKVTGLFEEKLSEMRRRLKEKDNDPGSS